MQLYELYTRFKLWMGMAETEIISKPEKPFSQAKRYISKENILLWKRRFLNYFKRPTRKHLGCLF